MLDCEGEVGHLAECPLHLIAPEAREDHDVVLRLGAERLQQRERCVGHSEATLLALVVEAAVGGGEGATPVEQDDTPRGAPVGEQHLHGMGRVP